MRMTEITKTSLVFFIILHGYEIRCYLLYKVLRKTLKLILKSLTFQYQKLSKNLNDKRNFPLRGKSTPIKCMIFFLHAFVSNRR